MYTVHSALEGFCRAFSDTDVRMTKTDLDDAAFDVGWSFFPDRFDSVLASGRRNSHKCKETWTLSNDILQGKCRQKTFEVQWAHRTIVRKPGNDANLHEAAEIERAAVLACVEASLLRSREGFERTALYSLACNEPVQFFDGSAPSERPALVFFCDTVLGAMCAGMLNEGQDAYEVEAYRTSVGDFVNDACEPLERGKGQETLLKRIELLKRIVAGIVYGPAHPLALSHENVNTNPYDDAGLSELEGRPSPDGQRCLALFQTFDRKRSTMGRSVHVLEPSEALFVGRSDKLEDYQRKIGQMEACGPASDKDAVLLAGAVKDALSGKRLRVWKLPDSHRGVSNAHGLVVYVGGALEDDEGDPGLGWTYFDLQSKNKTWCDGSVVSGMRKVNRGATLFLGPDPDVDRLEDSSRSYRVGACIATAEVCG